MGDEINEQFSLTVENVTFKDTVSLGQLSFDQDAVGRGGHVQSIGTSEETLDFGDVAGGVGGTEGKLYIRNLDVTNYVDLGATFGTGNAELTCRLEPGEWMYVRCVPSAVWRAKADTAACLLDVRCYHD